MSIVRDCAVLCFAVLREFRHRMVASFPFLSRIASFRYLHDKREYSPRAESK